MVWEEYPKHQNNSKETIDKKIWHAKHFLPVFGDKNIADISLMDIKNFQLFIFKSKLLKPTTA
ncbi:MAG: hypothetical protein EVG15_07805 [Candidatus Acididesulfobacter diazotrophicus]|uniref:Integrase SAM-like N-terminal domain-containing protein n=1 Tax=Candidatus Acididesulfobacter diazotrophicus TaxID=2597226 RepID=A0A519BLD7_9DELT|nr:MAG: hypothetical protein EVG15_07805 [Candidatus Acididesulfobacter diazotrophicus]